MVSMLIYIILNLNYKVFEDKILVIASIFVYLLFKRCYNIFYFLMWIITNDNDINFDDGIWVKYSYQSEDEADCDEYHEYERLYDSL